MGSGNRENNQKRVVSVWQVGTGILWTAAPWALRERSPRRLEALRDQTPRRLKALRDQIPRRLKALRDQTPRRLKALRDQIPRRLKALRDRRTIGSAPPWRGRSRSHRRG